MKLGSAADAPSERASAVPRVWVIVPWIVLSILVVAYSGYFSVLSLRERDALYQFDEDLAIYDQIVWNTAHGRFFVSSLIQHANTMLGDHFSPVVVVFVPVFWIWSNAAVLLVGQSVLLALTAVPLFLFARKRLGSAAALLVVGAYLIYPALHYVNLFQFHEIALLPLPLAVAMLAIERGSRRLFFGSSLVALTVKEEVAIVVVALGLLWMLRRRDWRTGIATIGLGVVAGAITMGIILPHFNLTGSGYYYVSRYDYLGASPLQIAVTALTSPVLVLAHLTTPDRLLFLAQLFLPLALTPLIGWEYLVAALPVFGYLLLADSPDQYAINRHYLSPLLPFLFFGCALGLARISRVVGWAFNTIARKKIEPTFGTPAPVFPVSARLGTGVSATADRVRETAEQPEHPTGSHEGRVASCGGIMVVFVSSVVLASSAGASYRLGPTPLSRGYDVRAFTPTEHTRQLRRFIGLIPPSASISTSRNLLSWFSERERVYRFPEVDNADYVLLDWRDLRYPAVYSLEGGAFRDLLDSPRYRLVDSAGGATLFERGDPTAWQGGGDSTTRFADQIVLLGNRVRVDDSGHKVTITLYWRAARPMTKQYTVFVHLISSDGKTIGQGDSWPLDNLFPTDMWQPGHVVPDTHVVTVNELNALSGAHAEVGLYDLKTGARLPITARGLGGGNDFVNVPVSGG